MKQRVVEPQAATSWEPWAASLTVSVVLHILVVMGAMGSSWLWRASVFEPASSYRVALVDAPLSLRNPSPPPAAAPPPPKPEPKPEPAPEAATVKTPPDPQPAPEIKQTPSQPIQNKPVPAAAPTPDPKRPTAKPIKKTPQAAVKPQTATSSEAESALAALRQRQAEQEELKRQRTEAAAQQAAAQRVAALRDQVAEENTVGAAAVRAVGLRQVRLTAYQERVRTQIIDAWILPIPPEQSRDLQATVFFRVVRDGRVEQLHLVQASGHPLFDASLIRAIKRASPLPVLPADYPGEMLEVEMRFRARESSE